MADKQREMDRKWRHYSRCWCWLLGRKLADDDYLHDDDVCHRSNSGSGTAYYEKDAQKEHNTFRSVLRTWSIIRHPVS